MLSQADHCWRTATPRSSRSHMKKTTQDARAVDGRGPNFCSVSIAFPFRVRVNDLNHGYGLRIRKSFRDKKLVSLLLGLLLQEGLRQHLQT
ncbi:hypothetical protein L1987_64429 [Smallanthus sonchifolius]|uniref:Uncharacterized protein n=1 Tax=Smallanthus sonchifolius TaxID=185202 RepID=A0ACB9CFY9_9ASTR|nr:hypothetical protein L1987_64429 [Smallanthus sonchifolius]